MDLKTESSGAGWMDLDLDSQWELFTQDVVSEDDDACDPVVATTTPTSMRVPEASLLPNDIMTAELSLAPPATDIYISTKTIIAYLNTPIDLETVFWELPVLKYGVMAAGVVKKQMKFNSADSAQLQRLEERLAHHHPAGQLHVDVNVITHIDNPGGRVPFKDVRKISIGVSRKDILSCRCKKKSAFDNCFVILLRLPDGDRFREFHVKVFNTGKLEIPGVQQVATLDHILDATVEVLLPLVSPTLAAVPNSCETVLINSNFNCGFYLDREALCELLRHKYNIQTIYDACSYPGIQCKFPLDERRKVSFMVFRTGSVLIVGKCDEPTLYRIYGFLKDLLAREYPIIGQRLVAGMEAAEDKAAPPVPRRLKPRKRVVLLDAHLLEDCSQDCNNNDSVDSDTDGSTSC